jgi:hypothetical protein
VSLSSAADLLAAIDVQHLVLAAGVWVVLTLPPDHFEAEVPPPSSWTAGRMLRNFGGLVLVAIGAVLSIPGIPGQGVLTILVGLFLVDFPQRRRLERALVKRPGVLLTLNRLRVRFGRPPLLPPP